MREPVQKLVERYQQNLYAAAFNVCKNQMDAAYPCMADSGRY